jgi:undecaprenyl-diphosphatase
MTDILDAIVLGIVQGLTEFLPVSSTGHLVITQHLLGISEQQFGLRFDAAIHLGTLAAVLVYFRTTIVSIVRAWFVSLAARRWDYTDESRLAWLIILGTIPAGIAGLLLQDAIEERFRAPALVGAMLIVFCLPMAAAERWGQGTRNITGVRPLDALIIGCAQAVALIPGVSRSGITISAGMLVGFPREQAAIFAFLLSAPVIAAAGGKQVFDILRGAGEGPAAAPAVYLAGLVTAAVVGYGAIAVLVRFLRFNPLNLFIGYRIALGLLVLALVATGVL